MNIEFGGGPAPRKPSYKQCDIRNLPHIDFQCDAIDIDKLVNSNSVDNIFSRHFFEHLSFRDGEKLLNVWFKILKSNGKVEMIVPNITFHINQFLNANDIKTINWAKAGFWGWQRYPEDFHKSGYTSKTLNDLVTNIGFINFNTLSLETSPHLHVTFLKK